VMSQLHPEKPLERGYAIIRDASGKALTTRAEAAGEALLALQFRDGTLGVIPAESTSPPLPLPPALPPAPRKRATSAPTTQDDLFG